MTKHDPADSPLPNKTEATTAPHERDVRIRADVEALCGWEHRGAGTQDEADAATWMADTLTSLGFEVSRQPLRTTRAFSTITLSVLVGAIAAWGLSFWNPLVSLLLIAACTLLFIGEYTLWFPILRPLLARLPTQNIIGHYKPPNPQRTVIFGGHLDTAPHGLLFHPKLLAHFSKSPVKLSPLFTPLLSLFALLLAGGLAYTSTPTWLLSALQIGGIIGLSATSLLMLEWRFGPFVPGANDNASGIAATLTLARWVAQTQPQDTEFYFLGFGAEEPYLFGSSAFAKAYAPKLQKDSTYVINFDGVATGKLHYVTGENMLLPLPYARTPLFHAMQRLTQEEETFSSIQPIVVQGGTDAMPFLQQGLQAISLVCVEDNHIPLHYHRLTDRPENMHWEHSELAIQFTLALLQQLPPHP